MDEIDILSPFEKLLEKSCPPVALRAIEAGGSPAELWSAIAGSGFLDALVAEEAGGAGLSLIDAAPLLHALGCNLVPVPVAETMFARALLAGAGAECPEGPITLAIPRVDGDMLCSRAVPLAMVAQYALADLGDSLAIVRLADVEVRSTGVANSLAGDMVWTSSRNGARFARPLDGLRPIAAIAHASAIAGATAELARMTIRYAQDRVQFGKPIAAQQAIQQQLAVMAEQVVVARIAAQMGCARGFPPPLAAAAVAKLMTSSAAAQVAAIAHAVHGAIGMCEEYDLQLYVRRLYEWRMGHGSEAYWSGLLGVRRLDWREGTSLDFVRSEVMPAREALQPAGWSWRGSS